MKQQVFSIIFERLYLKGTKKIVAAVLRNYRSSQFDLL